MGIGRLVNAALLCAALLLLAGPGSLADWYQKDTETDYGTAEESIEPEGVPINYAYCSAWRNFGSDTPKDDLNAGGSSWCDAYSDPDHEAITVEGEVRDVIIKKSWQWAGCDPPPANAQFDLRVQRRAWWYLHGDAGNWWFTSGTAEAWAKFDLVINSSPDNAGDYQSTGDFHGRKTEGVDPWAISLSLSWPPDRDLAWDDRADGNDDTFKDEAEDYAPPIAQNISNQGASLVYTEITVCTYTKGETLTDACWGCAQLEVNVTDFGLAPQ